MRRATTKASTNTLPYYGSGGQSFGRYPAAAVHFGFVVDKAALGRAFLRVSYHNDSVISVIYVIIYYRLQSTIYILTQLLE